MIYTVFDTCTVRNTFWWGKLPWFYPNLPFRLLHLLSILNKIWIIYHLFHNYIQCNRLTSTWWFVMEVHVFCVWEIYCASEQLISSAYMLLVEILGATHVGYQICNGKHVLNFSRLWNSTFWIYRQNESTHWEKHLHFARGLLLDWNRVNFSFKKALIKLLHFIQLNREAVTYCIDC